MNNLIHRIFYKFDATHPNYLNVLLETSNGYFEIDNCAITSINAIDPNYILYKDLTTYYGHTPFILAIKYSNEMNLFIALDNGDFITIFRETDFNRQSWQELDIRPADGISETFIEIYNESTLAQFNEL